MSLTVAIVEWLELHTGKQAIAASIPGGGTYFHLNFALTFRCSQLSEDHTNEIKNDIHPEYWIHRDRFNILKYIYCGGLYDDMSALNTSL